MSAIRLIASATAVVLAATACGSDADGEPMRPAIARPLDAGVYADRACELLPRDVAVRLGYAFPTEHDATRSSAHQGQSASCDWSPPKSPSMAYELYLGHDELGNRYRNSKGAAIAETDEPWLEPLTIAGQPAAWIGRSHMKPNETCTIVIGLTDTQSVQVDAVERYPNPENYREPGRGDGRACEYALGVADAIVRNLGG